MSTNKEYIVKRAFFDKNEKKHYPIGALYSADTDRISFLQDNGFLGEEIPVKPEEKDDKFPKHTGGGWYQLSNGDKVQGKEEADAAEQELIKKDK